MKTKKVSFKDRKGVQEFGDEVMGRLKGLEAEFGVGVKQERGSFDPRTNTYTMKVTFSAPSGDGTVNPYAKEAAAWKVYAAMDDLPVDALGAVLVLPRGKGVVRIVGYEPRRRKYPVVVEDENGKVRLFVAADIARLCKAQGKGTPNPPKPSPARWGTALAGTEGLNPNGAGKCGDCLMERVEIVNLNADGTCPEAAKHAASKP